MTLLRLLLLLFLSDSLAAQQLIGTVTDCKYARPVEKMTVRLYGSDGSAVEVVTDKLGHYSIDLKPGNDYIASCNGGEAGGPHGVDTYYALLDKNKKRFSTKPDSTGRVEEQFTFDFCLIETSGCEYRFPSFIFEKNNTKPLQADTSYVRNGVDESWKILLLILNDNPSVVLELGGHADSTETRPLALSLKRAQAVADTLIKLGIAQDRLMVKEYGAFRPLRMADGTTLTQRYIRSRPKSEQEDLHMRNARVVFRVISWDYVPKKAGD